jgi:hypothetical protein
MTVVIALHDVHNVDHWLSSPKSDEIYWPLDITEVMASEAGSEATRYDGVRVDSASCSWNRSQGLRLRVPPGPMGASHREDSRPPCDLAPTRVSAMVSGGHHSDARAGLGLPSSDRSRGVVRHRASGQAAAWKAGSWGA